MTLFRKITNLLYIPSSVVATLCDELPVLEDFYQKYGKFKSLSENGPIFALSDSYLEVKDLNIFTPTSELIYGEKKSQYGDQILSNFTFIFKPGNVYKINGENGVGKTSLFKTLCELWPYANGIINIPCEILYLPKIPYSPSGLTLIESLCYPKKPSDFNNNLLTDIKNLLVDLGEIRLIKDIDKVDRWQSLTSGQKQKLSAIKACLFKSKVTLCDEPLSDIDQHFRPLTCQVLKDHLSDKVLIYTGHTQETFENQIVLNYKPLLQVETLGESNCYELGL